MRLVGHKLGGGDTISLMEKESHSFEDLLVWKESMNLCKNIYKAFNTCMDYGLKSQIQRSAVSVVSNIAEGYELDSHKQLIRHFNIAKGSCGELRAQLYIAIDQQAIAKPTGDQLLSQARKVSSMLHKFIQARKKWDQSPSK